MTSLTDPLEDYLNAIDPRLNAIVKAADRRDRTALPALDEALEQALAWTMDAKGMSEKVAVETAGKSQSERTSAVLRAMGPLHALDHLATAAMQIPDASLEPVLKSLSQRVSHEGVRDALAQVRAGKPSFGRRAKVVDLALPTDQPLGDGSLAKMVIDKDSTAILDAVTEASIGDLLGGLAQSIRQDQRYRCGDLAAACGRYPEAEVLFVIRPWIEDADPCRREAAAWALNRAGEDGVAPDPRAMTMMFRLLEDREPMVAVRAIAAIGTRTNRNFTSTLLARLRTQCERHLSADVRRAYSDVSHSPDVGGTHAYGALDAWCAMTRDDDRLIRQHACGRLIDCLDDGVGLGQIGVALNAAKTDASPGVRCQALVGLAQLGRFPATEIERELTAIADRLEGCDLSERTGDEDDGLHFVAEMVSKPSRRFVPALERIVEMIRAADIDWTTLSDVLEACRRAPHESFLSRFV